MSKKITCKLCGQDAHVMEIHLRDYHGKDSDYPCTIAGYKKLHPEAPLISDIAQQKYDERKKEGLNSVVEKADTSEGSAGALAKLFNLGKIATAKTQAGADIMVNICEDEGFEELIPAKDPNYVYDVDILKSVLMGLHHNLNVYIFGHAGVGKSTLFEQVCAATKRRLLRVQHTIDTESSHILGQWGVDTKIVKNTDGSETVLSVTKWSPGPLQLAMKHGWLYLADEYDRGHPSVLSAYQAVLEGKPLYTKEADEEHRHIVPHPSFRFGATGNTNGSGDETGLHQATVVQDAATIERFAIVLQQGYMSPKQETAIVQGQARLMKEDAAKIIDFARRVRELHPSSVSLSLGPRVAINIGKIGLMRGDFKKGVELAFTNRLPEGEREAVNQVAQRVFG